MDVSIIIVSYNAKTFLQECLDSLRANSGGLKTEVFVVDNASRDGSADFVEANYPEVRLIRNNVNAGFAAANNLAFPLAAGEFILLLNNDTKVLPGCLKETVDFLRSRPDCGGVGCKLIGEDGQLQSSVRRFKTVLNEIWPQIPILYRWHTSWGWGDYDLSHLSQSEASVVEYVCGAFLMLRRTAIDKTGYLDERFFMYSEEEDLCLRLKKAGWDVCYLPTATTIHYGGGSSRTCPGAMNREFHRSRLMFISKHKGKLAEMVFRVLCAVTTVLAIVSRAAVYMLSAKRRERTSSEIKAMLQGLSVCLAPLGGRKNGYR